MTRDEAIRQLEQLRIARDQARGALKMAWDLPRDLFERLKREHAVHEGAVKDLEAIVANWKESK